MVFEETKEIFEGIEAFFMALGLLLILPFAFAVRFIRFLKT